VNVTAIKARSRIEQRLARRVCLRCPALCGVGVLCPAHAAENRERAATRFSALRGASQCVSCQAPVRRSEQLGLWGGVDVVAEARCPGCASVHRFKQTLQVACHTQGTLL